jgi:peptidoglycan/LPS O-acetylase OafA/YrhL
LNAERATTDRSGHIVELQSLRGIAATAVAVGHALNYYATPDWFRHAAYVFNGRAAVVVFFVLSGYVLTRSQRRSTFDTPSIVRFYIQRLFRIYPAIWAASVLGLLYLFLLHWRIPVPNAGGLVRSQFRTDRMDVLHIVASLAGMLAFILPQLWSIFVEIVASAALPLIAFFAFHRRAWFIGAFLFALLASYAIGKHTYYLLGLYFVDFVAGAALAMPGSPAKRIFSNAPAPLVVGGGLILLALTLYIPLEYYDPTAQLIEMTLAATVIATLVYAKRRVAILASRPLVFLGDISYSFYLLHYVVLCTLAKGAAVLQAGLGVELDTITLSILVAGLTILLTTPLAWLSFTYVEKPGVRLGKALLGRLPARTTTSAPDLLRPDKQEAALPH